MLNRFNFVALCITYVQTVKALIRELLQEPSDLGLNCFEIEIEFMKINNKIGIKLIPLIQILMMGLIAVLELSSILFRGGRVNVARCSP